MGTKENITVFPKRGPASGGRLLQMSDGTILLSNEASNLVCSEEKRGVMMMARFRDNGNTWEETDMVDK